MFYQKERKIQIFLKNENYTAARKRRASSDSVDSESVRGSPVSPVKKIKIKKVKRDPQTSSVGSADKKVKTPTGSLSPRSVSVLPPQPQQPQSAPLSPTKSIAGGKKVPIYHNAHKIFRAQQFARQMKTNSSEAETVKSQAQPPPLLQAQPPPLLQAQPAPLLQAKPPLQSKTLSDAAKLYVQPPVLQPCQSPPPPLSPPHVPCLLPLNKYQPTPSLTQPAQKGAIFHINNHF